MSKQAEIHADLELNAAPDAPSKDLVKLRAKLNYMDLDLKHREVVVALEWAISHLASLGEDTKDYESILKENRK